VQRNECEIEDGSELMEWRRSLQPSSWNMGIIVVVVIAWQDKALAC
jgi:hypothetical protein